MRYNDPGKKKVNISLFADEMFVHIENLRARAVITVKKVSSKLVEHKVNR